MKIKIGNTLFLLTLFALASCGNVNSSTNSVEESNAIDIGGAANIKNVVSYLHRSNSYKISTVIDTASDTLTYESHYSHDYYYSTFDASGYAQDENGVFKLNSYQGDFVSSELLKDDSNNYLTNVWESDLFISFANVDIDNFTSTTDSSKVTNKQDKLYILDMMNIGRGILTEIKQFDLTINSDNNLLIEITTDSTAYSAVVNYQTDLSFFELEDYLSQNSYYQTTEDEQYLQTSFAADNYARVIYNTDGKTVAGWEHFTPNYFYGEYTEETEKANGVTSSGYVCLVDFSSNGTIYNGMYYFFISDTGIGLTLASDNADYDINSFMNYPSNLLAFNNLQFFNYYDSTNEYVSLNSQIAEDFMNNFQVEKMFPGQALVATELSYKTANDFSQDYIVTFTLSFEIDESSAYMEFEFTNFGSANIDEVDAAFNF